MHSILVAVVLAASTYIAPTPAGDINSFIRFMWANERCPGVAIDFEKTLEQVRDLGLLLKWDDERIRDKILVETRIAQFEYQQDRADFCVAARKLYDSYDPAHLRKVGVIN